MKQVAQLKRARTASPFLSSGSMQTMRLCARRVLCLVRDARHGGIRAAGARVRCDRSELAILQLSMVRIRMAISLGASCSALAAWRALRAVAREH